MDDLFQVGVIGLIKAIDNFNTALNVRFSTYAVPMIIGEIRRFLRDNNPIRVSRSLRDTAYKAMQVKEMLTNKYNKEPVYNDGGDTIFVMDQIGDNSTDADWVDEIMMKDKLNNLDDREHRILYMRFMQGKTQMETAEEIGISQAQVSRLEKNALKRIKNE